MPSRILSFSATLFMLVAILAGVAPQAAADEMLEQKIDKAFEAGELPGLHSVLIIHKGEVLAERHYTGADERWGRALGDRQHGATTLHDLRSVSKSIVGLLYGIALSEGLVPELDQPVIDQFPEYADLAKDPQRRKILVRHVLSMKMGTEWNEDLPYTDPANSEIAMERADDRYRFVLDRPMVNEPGDWWTYNGGATALAARLITIGSGMPIDEYAKKKLFAPLGIGNFEWVAGADGVPAAASGLRLNIHDLAKIGRMILNDGQWEGAQIVPAEWLKASFTPYSNLHSGLRYGYFWWLAPQGDPPVSVAGFGNGGQRLSISKANDMIVAVFAGNYNDPEAWRIPVKILIDFAIPAARAD